MSRAAPFAWLTLGSGAFFSLVGLWARIVWPSSFPFALAFGAATFVLGGIALWLHVRSERRQESAGPAGP